MGSKPSPPRNTQPLRTKIAKKQDAGQALTTNKADLEGTQNELDAALAYFDKLKQSCVDSGVSYTIVWQEARWRIDCQEAFKILDRKDLA